MPFGGERKEAGIMLVRYSVSQEDIKDGSTHSCPMKASSKPSRKEEKASEAGAVFLSQSWVSSPGLESFK